MALRSIARQRSQFKLQFLQLRNFAAAAEQQVWPSAYDNLVEL